MITDTATTQSVRVIYGVKQFHADGTHAATSRGWETEAAVRESIAINPELFNRFGGSSVIIRDEEIIVSSEIAI